MGGKENLVSCSD